MAAAARRNARPAPVLRSIAGWRWTDAASAANRRRAVRPRAYPARNRVNLRQQGEDCCGSALDRTPRRRWLVRDLAHSYDRVEAGAPRGALDSLSDNAVFLFSPCLRAAYFAGVPRARSRPPGPSMGSDGAYPSLRFDDPRSRVPARRQLR